MGKCLEWAWMLFYWLTQILIACKYQLSFCQKMSMVVTTFNIVTVNLRVFTHSSVWWNQLNRLGNTFIHENVSVSKLKTIKISLVVLWMFFEVTISWSHVVFGIWDESEDGRRPHHVHPNSVSERQHALVMRLLFQAIFAIFCEILSILLCTHSVLYVMDIRYGPTIFFINN